MCTKAKNRNLYTKRLKCIKIFAPGCILDETLFPNLILFCPSYISSSMY